MRQLDGIPNPYQPRTYRREMYQSRRRLLAGGAAAAAVAAVVGHQVAVAGGGGRAANPTERPTPVEYVVQAGDTAWNIADRFSPPEEEIRDDVDAIMRQTDGILRRGARITLPEDLIAGYQATQAAQESQQASPQPSVK